MQEHPQNRPGPQSAKISTTRFVSFPARRHLIVSAGFFVCQQVGHLVFGKEPWGPSGDSLNLARGGRIDFKLLLGHQKSTEAAQGCSVPALCTRRKLLGERYVLQILLQPFDVDLPQVLDVLLIGETANHLGTVMGMLFACGHLAPRLALIEMNLFYPHNTWYTLFLW